MTNSPTPAPAGTGTVELTAEQLQAGLQEARRIIENAAGYYFGGELTAFAPEFKRLALESVATLTRQLAEAQQDTARLDHLDSLPSGITINSDARFPSFGVTPKESGSHTRWLIDQDIRRRADASTLTKKDDHGR